MPGAPDPRPTPSASGTLASRPLVHLLVYARNRRLTGTLELHAADGSGGTIELWRGRISGARTTPPIAYFGTVAYELGCIDTVVLDATLLHISRTKQLHGEVLVERGAITAAQRDVILAEQACRKIHHLFSLPEEATFAFYDARPDVQEPPLALDAIKPAWRGLRDHIPTKSVREVLERYAAIALRLSSEGPGARGAFNAEESALCDALASRAMTLAEMRAASALPAHRVDLLAYLLVITKSVEPATASAPTAPPGEPAEPRRPAPATSEPATTGARRAPPDSGEVRVSLSFRVPSVPAPSIASAPSSWPRVAAAIAPVLGPADLGALGVARRAQSVDREDFFETLGLPEGATVDAARAAYFRLARLWHPDRLPADLEPFRSEAEKVFTHMIRASATLTDPAARRSYLETRDPNAAAIAVATRPRKDVVRDIEQAIGRRDFLGAEQTAGHLLGLDADDAEAQALAAWAFTLAGEASLEVLGKALPRLDKAVHADASSERAHFYRGVVHKRLGSTVAAFRDFARVVQLNPGHVDAQRELRILHMRSRNGSGEHPIGAVTSKAQKK